MKLNTYKLTYLVSGSIVVVWQLDLQLAVQSVHNTTHIVSSIPVDGEVYTTQHYVIKFISHFRRINYIFDASCTTLANFDAKS